MTAIAHRYEFVYLFDITNGNPNGDPDAGNLPRLDPETNRGLVTDVCLKRKIRNFVSLDKDGAAGYAIYMQEKAVLNDQHQKAWEALRIPPDAKEQYKKLPKDEAKARELTAWMCANFFDVRTFGAVMTTGVNAGQVRGPVQIAFATSIDPVVPLEISITRMAVTTEKEAEAQSGDNRTMGRKHIIPYGLYRAHGFVSAKLAGRTGFSNSDLELFWRSLTNMFEHDRSAARGEMSARKLIVFEHDSAMGNAPAHRLFDSVHVTPAQADPAQAPRSFADYCARWSDGARDALTGASRDERGHCMEDDDDFIALSALQHYLYCPRQCALIHVERLWAENVRTAEGRLLHERADQPRSDRRRGVRTVTAMPLANQGLGIAGIADVVEFHQSAQGQRIVPVEYKRGRPKAHRADEVQLCAQALCLEAMTGHTIAAGALFYGDARRRTDVAFDDELRRLTLNTVAAVRAMVDAGVTPTATWNTWAPSPPSI